MNSSCGSRIKALRKNFGSHHVDGILFSNMSNIRYLSGFTGSDGVLILSSDHAILLVDGRYATQAEAESKIASVHPYQNKMEGIEQGIAKLGIKEIGFEAGHISMETFQDLSRRLEGKGFVPLGDPLRFLRARKDKNEIAVMKKAASIGSAAINALIREIKIGWTEKEAALHLEMIARRGGADQIAFETIFASGAHSALPHAKPTNRKVQKGDFVVIDFGVRYQGYCSDETCTVAFGELTGDQKNAYRAVRQAHDESIGSVKAGTAAADVDALTRRVLGKKYRDYFVHGTGHGVGLEVHEAPRLAPNSPDALAEGMVVTIEPGLYYPGAWGIRIEDTVVVNKNGCDVITKMDKGLIIIE